MAVRALVSALIAFHGLVHLVGTARGFGFARLPEFSQPVSRPAGALWLVAGGFLVASAALWWTSARSFWIAGLLALVLSQALIFSAWQDARFGTLPNLILLALVGYGFASQGPWSFSARYRADTGSRLVAVRPTAEVTEAEVTDAEVTEADLSRLPTPVQRYLRLTGAVGRPPATGFEARWRGRIRSGPGDPWMTFAAEQVNRMDEPARFFLMKARRGGLPVDVYHAFEGGAATMQVRLLSIIPLVAAGGPEMTQGETVTLLNDLVLLAPSALLGPETRRRIRWDPVDERTARVWYAVGGIEVGATLHFNDRGELVDFVSDDRLAVSADGRSFEAMRWSTPVDGYRDLGSGLRMSRGSGLWHAPGGAYPYIELELVELEVEPRAPQPPESIRSSSRSTARSN